MSVAARVTVSGAVRAAFGFWRRGASGAAGILAFAGAAAAWTLHVAQFPDRTVVLVALAVMALLWVLAEAALYRIALHADRPKDEALAPGPLGLQVGRLELDVFLASLLQTLLTLFVASLLLLAMLAFSAAVAMATGRSPESFRTLGGSQPLILIAFVLALTVFLLTQARLSLHRVASAAEQGVRVLSAAVLTRGYAWRILLAGLVVSLPAIGVTLLAAKAWAALGGDAIIPDPVQALGRIVGGLALAFYILPVTAGLTGYLYARLGPTSAPGPKGS